MAITAGRELGPKEKRRVYDAVLERVWWGTLERARRACVETTTAVCVARRENCLRSGDAMKHTYESLDDPMAGGLDDEDASECSDDDANLEDVEYQYPHITAPGYGSKKAGSASSSSSSSSSFSGAVAIGAEPPPTPGGGLGEDDFMNDLDALATPLVEPTLDALTDGFGSSSADAGRTNVYRVVETFLVRRANNRKARDRVFADGAMLQDLSCVSFDA